MLLSVYFILSCILLAGFLGISKKKEPLIEIDEKWEHLHPSDVISTLYHYAEQGNAKSENLVYEISNSYDIFYASNRYFVAKKNYENHRHNTHLQAPFGYATIFIMYVFLNNIVFWQFAVSLLVAIVLSIVSYILTIKFYSRNTSFDIAYLEYEWSDNKVLSPKDFEKCYNYFNDEKQRCYERLISRAIAYEQALAYEKYNLNAFRWASVFFVIASFLASLIFLG